MSPGGGNLSIVASEGDVDSPSAAGLRVRGDGVALRLTDLVLTAAVYGATLLLGLVGNLLIVYTVSRFPRMRSIANLFLASLASADQLIVLLCVRVKFGQLFSYTWTLGEVGCKFLLYVQHVSMICSVLNLTFLSIESYYAVIHLVRCRYLCTISQARRVIIFTWPVAFLTALPIIFVYIYRDLLARRAPLLVLFLHFPWLGSIYNNLIFLKPCCTVIRHFYREGRRTHFCGKALCKLNSQSAPGSRELRGQGSPRGGWPAWRDGECSDPFFPAPPLGPVIKMLILVVSLFVISWAPILVLNVLTAFGGVSALNCSYLKPLSTTFHLLSYLNSCVNPLVYGFMSRSFRCSFRDTLLGCLGQRGGPQRGATMRLSRTRTTCLSPPQPGIRCIRWSNCGGPPAPGNNIVAPGVNNR
ncbi:hypothetical protein HPB48_018158 [Haemaphysalis longicornis]|uniref:G-protein coupled receptors family 1 profile domain-containing protein n=1 Tax=Haemaphysalis longicornis TaxID=44386 RepID=A0A9J6FV47_HAELO|nr:hypothetical protein HPB48_018158 [Haemaphysalis longicornis]